MDWHTEDIKEEEKVSEEEEKVSDDVEVVDTKPEYKDYRNWKEIPEKERKYYGI